MSFPWITEAQRRRQREDFAARAMADFSRQYRGHVDRINRATDDEIAAAMAAILRRQRDVNVLRPGRRVPRGSSALSRYFHTGIMTHD
jgi:hypothetical protein